MATNNNINYGPAALPGTVPTPVLGNNIDRAPAPVDPGVGTGYVPTVTRPVVPVTEQPVINPPIVVARTAVVIPAAEQPVSEVVAESTTEPNIPASNQQRYLTILANGSVVTDNASTLDFEGNGFTITSSGPYGAVISGYGNSNVVTFLANYGSNTISTVGNITGNFVAPGGNGQVMYNRNGVIGASPNDFNFDQSTETLYVTTGSFAGSANTGIDAVYGGVPGYTVLGSAIMAQFTGNTNTYSQVNFQNINNGTRSSGDYIITADNGTDDTYYLDLGLAGSNHVDPDFFGDTSSANDGYLYVTATDQAGPSNGAGNLILGSTNGIIKMFVGNTAQANVIATVESDGLNMFGAIGLAVYANTTVRDSSITSPTPGMMIYVTGTGMQVRGATSWNTIAGSGT